MSWLRLLLVLVGCAVLVSGCGQQAEKNIVGPNSDNATLQGKTTDPQLILLNLGSAVIPAPIDVMPKDDTDTFTERYARMGHNTPIAILSGPMTVNGVSFFFDARYVDLNSIHIEVRSATGGWDGGRSTNKVGYQDVNHDGYKDVIVYFYASWLNPTPGFTITWAANLSPAYTGCSNRLEALIQCKIK